MTRRGLLTLALLAGNAAPAGAEAAGPAAPIAALNQALLRIMQAGRAMPFEQRAQVIAPAVNDAFDLRQILQTSVGPRWAAIPPAQQDELLRVFTRYTVASYVANFDSYDGQRLDILPQTRPVGADVVVATQIVPRTGAPTRIDYVMRRTGAGWRAVDVLLDGTISRVAVQRSDFRSLMSSGDPAPLIASLRRKTAALEAGDKT